MKNPLTPAGIEPATFRIVAQHFNHRATAVPHKKVHSTNTAVKSKITHNIKSGLTWLCLVKAVVYVCYDFQGSECLNWDFFKLWHRDVL